MPFLQPTQVISAKEANVLIGNTRLTRVFRLGLFALGGILCLYSFWQLGAEALRPNVPYFLGPMSVDATHERTAKAAAWLGWLRGDLWFDEGLVRASKVLSRQSGDAPDVSALDQARAALIRSVRLAPSDARAWLLLAMVDARLGLGGRQQVEALKMSYYTGPNDLALVPWRMPFAVRSTGIKDADFNSLVEGEVRAALREPSLRPILIDSYRTATVDGRRFLESSIGALDPALLARLKAVSEPQPRS